MQDLGFTLEENVTGILDDLDQENLEDNRTCKYKILTSFMDQQDQDDLNAALKQDYTTTAIQRVLKKRGILIGYSTIGRHRRGECVCGIS